MRATGKQVWDLEIADYKFGYYISVTPLVVKDRLIMGMSNDQSDIRGISGGAESGGRQGPLALGRGAEAGRTGRGDLAECRHDGARRRRDVDSRIVRSRV